MAPAKPKPVHVGADDEVGGRVGAWITKLNGHNVWELGAQMRTQWEKLATGIKQLLCEQSEPVARSVMWSPFMIGKTMEAARPTVMFCSRDGPSRKTVRDIVRQSRILEQSHPRFVTAERSHPPGLDNLALLQADEDGTGSMRLVSAASQDATIYAKTPSGECRQAVVGGIVCIHGVRHYLTVAHIFTQQSDFRDWDGTNDGGESEWDASFEVDSEDEEESGNQPQQAVRDSDSPTGATSSTAENYSLPVPSGLVSTPSATTPTVKPVVPRKILISTSEAARSLDYALVEMTEPDFHSADEYVLVKMPSAYHGPPGQQRAIDVVAVTAKNGIGVPGRLLPTSSFITTGSVSHAVQEIWTVRLDTSLVAGVCGTWVLDLHTRELYGHIVAGGIGTGVAYIVPAYQVFEDVSRHVGPIAMPPPPAGVMYTFAQHAVHQLRESDRSLRITLVGLPAAGKTTLVKVLSDGATIPKGQLPRTMTTSGLDIRTVKSRGVSLDIWDLGGLPHDRWLWRQSLRGGSAIVFMVDSGSRGCEVSEARDALHRLLADSPGAAAGAPLLVLNSKCDIPGGFTAEELSTFLELDTIRDRDVACFPISSRERTNLDLLLGWLVALLRHRVAR